MLFDTKMHELQIYYDEYLTANGGKRIFSCCLTIARTHTCFYMRANRIKRF